MFTRITKSPGETAALAELAGQKIKEGTVICLEGALGAGKTLFAQNIARTLGAAGEVTSPTFSLMNIYEGICPIIHFDLYRLEDVSELEDIGFYEYTDEPDGVVIIEWSDKFPAELPENYLAIRLEKITDKIGHRRITFSCVGERDQEALKELDKHCRF